MSLSKIILSIFCVSLLACTGSEGFEPDPDRKPLGKADSVGSCEDHCGEQSDGSCWCDEECSYYGDCCEDKVELCDAPQLTICGGKLGGQCAEDEYCHYDESAICGWADATGVCMPKPDICTEQLLEVCGCNGETYSNACKANAAGTSVQKDGACDIFCGGIGGLTCPSGMECQPYPNDPCVENGGADCGGRCVESECSNITCNLYCPNGFKTGEDGCATCECAPAPDSCMDSCGGQSDTGECWCDELCQDYGDCCEDIADFCDAAPTREIASGMCVKNSGDECETDADCTAGGCGGELCFNPEVSSGISTCECTAPMEVSGCGCVNGSCNWYNE